MTIPRKEGADHVGATNVELDPNDGGGDAAETLAAPVKADRIRVLVTNADGSFDVTIAFANTSVTKSGGSGSDVDVDRACLSNDEITVTISDTSGASNSVDYDMLVI